MWMFGCIGSTEHNRTASYEPLHVSDERPDYNRHTEHEDGWVTPGMAC